MKNSTYWANRFKALEDEQYRKSAAFVEGLKHKFDYANEEIQKNLSKWYSRLGANTNTVTLADTRKLLKADELKEFHWTLEQYTQYAKEHGLDPKWIAQLENASAKKHISRYEQIETQMRQIEEKLYAEYNNECYGYLGNVVRDSYYKTAYEIEKGTGIGVNIHRLNAKLVEKYLTHPWCQDGKVFSDRIWQRKDELVRTLDQELTRQLITGADPQKAIDAIAAKFDVSKRQAGTLVMTESAAIASEASKDSMKDLGVEEYEILATLDSHTSEICQEMDGKHFRMSEYEPGLTAPPFHPNCRSTTIPYFDDEFTADETRAARDAADEGYERVPADMKYKEWKEKYIDGKEPDDVKYTPEQIESYKKQLTDIDGRITELRKQEEDITGYKHDEYLEYLKKNGSSVDKEFEGYEDEKKKYYEIQDQIKELEKQKKEIPSDAIEEINKTVENQQNDDIIKSIKDYNSDYCQKIGKSDYDIIHDKLDDCAEETLIEVWNKNEGKIDIAETDSKDGSSCDYYHLYLDMDAISKGSDFEKPYQVVFHESLHAIDYLNAKRVEGKGTLFSSRYKDGIFPKTITKEVKGLIKQKMDIIKQALKEHAGDMDWLLQHEYITEMDALLYKHDGINPICSESLAMKLLEKEIRSYDDISRACISDMIEGATKGAIKCGYGHEKKYWKDSMVAGINEGLAAEAFAEMGDSTIANEDALKLIKKYLPESYNLYLEMIGFLAK